MFDFLKHKCLKQGSQLFQTEGQIHTCLSTRGQQRY
jgi:hypothetical protein